MAGPWKRLTGWADSTAFLGLTVILYLMTAVNLPIDVDRGSLTLYLVLERPSLKLWFLFYLAATMVPVFLAGVWLKRWNPALPVAALGRILSASFLLMWAHPLGNYAGAASQWKEFPKASNTIAVFALVWVVLWMLFRVLALAVEGRGETPEVPHDQIRIVEYWFLGWALFYAVFAALLMRSLVFDRENSPYLLAGIGMAYWCFSLSVRVRRQAGWGVKNRMVWANLIAGLWVFCAVALWFTFRFWG